MANDNISRFKLAQVFKQNGFGEVAAELAARAAMDKDEFLMARAFALFRADGISKEVKQEHAAKQKDAEERAELDNLCNQAERGFGIKMDEFERSQILANQRAAKARAEYVQTPEEIQQALDHAVDPFGDGRF